jgi:hypothetical protein
MTNAAHKIERKANEARKADADAGQGADEHTDRTERGSADGSSSSRRDQWPGGTAGGAARDGSDGKPEA